MRHAGYTFDLEDGIMYADFKLENYYDDAEVARRLGVDHGGFVRVKMTDEELARLRDCQSRQKRASEAMSDAESDEINLVYQLARDTERLEGGE